jgi:ribonuclease HI
MRGQDELLPGFDTIGMKETIAVTSWYLWWLRRRRTHDENIPLITHCKMSILSITLNGAKAAAKPTGPKPHWSRPSPRIIKINVDGSFHSDTCAGSVGAVARDSLGKFIAASTVYLPSVASAAAAEAMAMREGLSLATRLGCSNVLMESDSTETVDACSGDEPWWGESSAIFADCVDLAALVGNVSFKHCPREANEAAHELARVCFSSISSCNWVDEPPSFLLEKLINDVIEL